ncbi:MAG: HNH endonuclease [Paucibacter sp.]|nr:HNH endonuclease [Roseateles sp.]
MSITQERLKELLHYEPETGVFTWRVYRCAQARAGDRAGTVSKKSGYRFINVDHGMYLAHRLAFFYMSGNWPSKDVDHLKGNRDDNRWLRIRELSRQQNMQNLQKAHRDNRTGLLGVIPYKSRFTAQIRAGGKNRHLGVFDTAEEAHAAYLVAKRDIHPASTI